MTPYNFSEGQEHLSTKPTKRSSAVALLAKLEFAPEGVVEAAVAQTGLFLEAIDYRMEQLDAATSAKSHYEMVRAEEATRLRERAQANGEKMTENSLEEKLLLSLKVHGALERWQEASRRDEYSKLVLEALRMRKDCIRFVADLTMGEHMVRKAAEMGSERASEIRAKLRSKYPGRND